LRVLVLGFNFYLPKNQKAKGPPLLGTAKAMIAGEFQRQVLSSS